MGGFSSLLGTTLGGYSLSKILSALVTLLVCLIAVRLIMKITTRLVDRMQKVNDRLQKLILTAVKTLLYVLTVIITAEALGFNTSSLTALLSVLTLGITLAAEDILSNVAGGLVILSSRPFAQGDFIEAGGVSGTVREIGLNHTKLETRTARWFWFPTRISSSKIINYTVLGRRRVVAPSPLPYDAPAEAVKAACMEAVSTVPNVLADPAPAVQVTNYGASSIEYTIFCWCAPEHYWPVYFAINENLRDAFACHNVEMTYDHLNVHILEKVSQEEFPCPIHISRCRPGGRPGPAGNLTPTMCGTPLSPLNTMCLLRRNSLRASAAPCKIPLSGRR